MRRYQLLASLLFGTLGVLLMMQGVKLKLQGDFGPGPGFMPFLVGALLICTCAAWGIQVAIAPSVPFSDDALPDGPGSARVLAVSVSLLLFAAVFDLIGFRLSMLGFLLSVPFIFGTDYRMLKVAIALVLSYGTFYLFERVLRVPRPGASIDALAALGL